MSDGRDGASFKAYLKPLTPFALIFEEWHVNHICLPRAKITTMLFLLLIYSTCTQYFFSKNCWN